MDHSHPNLKTGVVPHPLNTRHHQVGLHNTEQVAQTIALQHLQLRGHRSQLYPHKESISHTDQQCPNLEAVVVTN